MAMKIDWQFIDDFLRGESETDDITGDCKEEIQMFLQTHDPDAFSEESAEQLAGIWDLAYKDEYEAKNGAKIPNIFRVIALPKEEIEQEQEEVVVANE